MTTDEQLRIPLHARLANELRLLIANGTWPPGAQIPTEREFMERSGLSSTTVRQAVMTLVHEGALCRKAGKGTFVTQPPIGRALLSFSGFSEETVARGFSPGSKIVNVDWSQPSQRLKETLRLMSGEQVLTIERLRTVDAAVVALETVTFPSWIGTQLLKLDFATGSLTEALEGELRLTLSRAYQVVRAASANTRLSRHLEVRRGAPLLEIDRTAELDDDRPAYFSSSYYRADRYAYEGWVQRDQPAATGRALAGMTSWMVSK